jgi:general secretion pathway protein J
MRPDRLGTGRRAIGRRPDARGFTLLELLVAISVLAMISMIAWRGLDSLVATRERLAPESEDIRAMLVTLGQMERDLATVPNAALFGLRTLPLKVRWTEAGPYFDVLRMAAPQPGGATALQRVIWRVQDGVLVRAASAPLYQLREVTAAEITHTPLLANVRAIRVRVWRGTEWQVPAPDEADLPIAATVPGAPSTLVQGVEVEIERTDGKRYRRVMLVG